MEGNMKKVIELNADERKRECALGLTTMILISKFTGQDIMGLGEEYWSDLNRTLDPILAANVERLGDENLLEIEGDLRIIKEWLTKEMLKFNS